MITKIFRFWKKKPSFFKNAFYLTIVQLANYLLPFLTLPYLTRILDREKFGIIAFYQALANFFTVLCDYGYGLLAPREIALNRDDEAKLKESFFAIFWGKFFLFFIVLLIYLFMAFFIAEVQENIAVGFLFLAMIFGQVIFPHWYFQGLETMGKISIFNFSAKFLSTVLIFLFVKTKNDFLLVPMFYAVGWLFSGILGLYLALSSKTISFSFPTEAIKRYLKEGFTYFIPNLSGTSFQTMTPFILGVLAGAQEVALFSVSERIVGAVKFLLHPIQQSLFPFLARKIQTEKEKSFPFLRKVLFFVAVLGILVFWPLFLFAEEILEIVAGKAFIQSKNLLKILAIHPFLVSLSGVLGIQILVNLGKSNLYAKIIFLSAVMNLILLPIFIHFSQALGAVISITLAEFFIFGLLFYFVKKLGIFYV